MSTHDDILDEYITVKRRMDDIIHGVCINPDPPEEEETKTLSSELNGLGIRRDFLEELMKVFVL